MSISFIAAAANAGSSVTLSAHQPGDILIGFAYTDFSNTPPPVSDTTWRIIQSNGGANNGGTSAWKIAETDSETFSAGGNVTHCIVAAYRSANLVFIDGTNQFGSGTGVSNFSDLPAGGGLSVRYVGLAGSRDAANDSNVPPTGMVNRVTTAGGTGKASLHDSDGETTSNWSYAAVTYTTGNLSAASRTSVLRMVDRGAPLPGGGTSGSRLVGPSSLVTPAGVV